MEHRTHTTNAGLGNVVAPRSCGSATFAGIAGAPWHVDAITASYVVMTDTKLRGRWPEEVASH